MYLIVAIYVSITIKMRHLKIKRMEPNTYGLKN